MPVYCYQHPKTKKIIEIIQGMNDIHEFADSDGIKYQRLFLNPRTAVDTQMDPFSKKDWMRRTNKKGITVGDMMDESSQLSDKRATQLGSDPIKQKVFDHYRKKTGKPHPEDKPRKIETRDYVLEL